MVFSSNLTPPISEALNRLNLIQMVPLAFVVLLIFIFKQNSNVQLFLVTTAFAILNLRNQPKQNPLSWLLYTLEPLIFPSTQCYKYEHPKSDFDVN